jgi:hypothetical protein
MAGLGRKRPSGARLARVWDWKHAREHAISFRGFGRALRQRSGLAAAQGGAKPPASDSGRNRARGREIKGRRGSSHHGGTPEQRCRRESEAGRRRGAELRAQAQQWRRKLGFAKRAAAASGLGFKGGV